MSAPPGAWVGHAWRDDPIVRFDPDAHTVAQIIAHVAEHPEDREEILAAELDGRARRGVIARLG